MFWVDAGKTDASLTFVKRLFGLSPFLTVSFCCVIYGLLRPPFTLPILLLIPPTLSINLLLEDDEGLMTPAGLALTTGLFFLLSSLFAVLGIHGRFPAMSLVTLLSSIGLLHCWNQRRRLARAFHRTEGSVQPLPILANALLLTAVLSYFIYSLRFWMASEDNSLHAHYLQSAWYLLRYGRYFFLSPAQDIRDNFNFWYPNFNAHLNLWGACFLNWDQAVRFNAALGSFITWSGYAVLLFFLIKDAQLNPNVSVALLIACLCSYSFFKIGPELSTDTPILLFIPAWLHYSYLAYSRKSPVHLGAVFALAFLSLSMRFHAGFALTLASVGCAIALPEGRLMMSAIPRRLSAAGPVLLLVIVLIGSTHWYILLYQKTRNPFHPYQPKNDYLQLKPRAEYLTEYNWDARMKKPIENTADGPPDAGIKGFILYNFFAISRETLRDHRWVKILRGILHGFTFSSFLTGSMLMGLLTIRWGQKKTTAVPAAALLASLGLFMLLAGRYYKFLYVIYGTVVYFSGEIVCRLQRKRVWPATLLMTVFGGVFVLSYLMTGFGTESNRWNVLKALKVHRDEIPPIKSYAFLEVARQFRPSLHPDDRILSFHAEPGFQLNYYLHNGYYFEDYNYSLSNTENLHKARTEEDVLAWLRNHHVRWIVDSASYIRDSYLHTPNPELLPKMIVAKSPKLKWLTETIITPES
jgi:hypothetical protein